MEAIMKWLDWPLSFFSFNAWLRLREQGYSPETIRLVWQFIMPFLGAFLGVFIARMIIN